MNLTVGWEQGGLLLMVKLSCYPPALQLLSTLFEDYFSLVRKEGVQAMTDLDPATMNFLWWSAILTAY